jgi:UDP-N-acetyl-D-mannosaminuronate dehydrogenase
VPTLLTNDKTIDTIYLQSAISTVKAHVKPGSAIIIESSVAVGMTRSLVGPLIRTKNFMDGMSIERINPGRVEPTFEEIPKTISSSD